MSNEYHIKLDLLILKDRLDEQISFRKARLNILKKLEADRLFLICKLTGLYQKLASCYNGISLKTKIDENLVIDRLKADLEKNKKLRKFYIGILTVDKSLIKDLYSKWSIQKKILKNCI